MAISPTGERMRIVLNLPALKRIMSISFRKARAHGSSVRRLRGEGAGGLTLFDENAERLTSTLCRFVMVIKSDRSCCHRKAKDLSLCLRRGWTLSLFLQFIYNLSPRAAQTEIHLLTGHREGGNRPLRSCCVQRNERESTATAFNMAPTSSKTRNFGLAWKSR
jgi:hypothetical protein